MKKRKYIIISINKKNEYYFYIKSYVSLYNHVFDILMNFQKYGTAEVDEE